MPSKEYIMVRALLSRILRHQMQAVGREDDEIAAYWNWHYSRLFNLAWSKGIRV